MNHGAQSFLFQSPLYSQNGIWSDYHDGLIQGCYTVDYAAIAAVLSFNFAIGDRTLFNEIKRQPWLSHIDQFGAVHYRPIPPHGFNWGSSEIIAGRLLELLLEEAREACRGRKEIYLLLSGGLDSRIVAGVVARLYRGGQIPRPVGVTWGLEDSRDVQYARKIAEILDFDWQHVPMGPRNILENIHDGFQQIAGLVSPNHLHAMLWFKNVSPDALVLAGSYGDSIGRAEFSGRHVLELTGLIPANPFGILKPEVASQAQDGILEDIAALRQRVPASTPNYAILEHQMQGFYMRSMIGHVMSVINRYCTLYQMFTAPQVYSYMWSLHPARRDDSIYAALLENHLPELARLPWARTNRALSGKTVGADPKLLKEFHCYADWCSGPLYDEIRSLVEPEWFESTGIFNANAIKFLNESLSPGKTNLKHLGNRPYDIWLWLAGFRVFYEQITASGRRITLAECSDSAQAESVAEDERSNVRRHLASNRLLHKTVSRLRRWAYKRNAIQKYPPQYIQ